MTPQSEPLPASIRSLEERAERDLVLVQRLAPKRNFAKSGQDIQDSRESAPELDPLEDPAGDVELIDAALAKVTADPGALFEHEVLDAIRSIRATNPADYQRVRAKAKDLKCSVTALDKLTAPNRDDADVQLFADVEPWPDPVDGVQLLDDIATTISRYVIADSATIRATALWAVHSWCLDTIGMSPIAHISAPEKRCGKTVLLSVLARLVYRPLPASNISPAALFRSVEKWQPTLLIDEADSFLRDNEELRGIINSGVSRDMAFVIRCVGDDSTPTHFSTWGAKALCGIGRLADTIEDRSIPLRLRRKTGNERVERLGRSDPELWENLRSRIARCAGDTMTVVGTARPEPVPGLHDRANDCWEPLLAIAEFVGGKWPAHARAAAAALHGIEDGTQSVGVELLADIRTIFEHRNTPRLASRDLLAVLVEEDEGPWATWNRGKPLSARQLAARLKEFGISSATMRLPNDERLKGYAVEDFTDAFRRYLSGEGVHIRDSVTMAQPCGFQGIDKCDTGAEVTDGESPEMALDSQCHAVTDKTPLPGENNESEAFDL